MKYDIMKLDQNINNAKKKLNRLVEEEIEYSKLYEQSIRTDQIIMQYLETKRFLKRERRKIMKDYSELLNQTFRVELITKINQEVRKDFPNISEKELNHFSNNVYICAVLKAYKVEEQDIIEQLLYLNNKYFTEMQEDGLIKDSSINSNNIEYLTKLNEKYLKIIKKRI